MSFNLVSLVKDQVTDTVLEKASGLLGGDGAKVASGVESAIPALLGGLSGAASDPGRANVLFDTLSRTEDNVLTNFEGALGGANAGKMIDQGSSLLTGLMGSDTVDRLGSAVSSATGMSQSGSGTLMGMLVPPMLGVLKNKVIGGGLDAGGMLSMLNDQQANIADAMPSGLASQLGNMGGFSALSGIGDGVSNMTGAATAAVGGAAATVAAGVGAAAGRVGDVAGGAMDSVQSGVGSVTGKVGDMAGGAVDSVQAGVGAAAGKVGDMAGGAVGSVQAGVGKVGDMAGGAVDSVQAGVGKMGNMAGGAVDSMQAGVGAAAGKVGDMAGGAVDSVQAGVGKVGDMAGGAVDSVQAGVGAAAGKVGDMAGGAVGSVQAGVGKVGDMAGGAVGSVQAGVGKVGDMAGGAVDSVQAGVGSAAGKVGDMAGGAVDSVQAGVGAAADKAGDVAQSGAEAASTGLGWLKWLLPLIILAALGWFAYNYFVKGDMSMGMGGAATEATSAVQGAVGDVNVTELSGNVSGMFNKASEALGGITDVDSAKAALPALEELSGQAAGLPDMLNKIPEAARGPLQGVVSQGMGSLQPMVDKAMAIPGVGGVLEPVIKPLMETLGGLTG